MFFKQKGPSGLPLGSLGSPGIQLQVGVMVIPQSMSYANIAGGSSPLGLGWLICDNSDNYNVRPPFWIAFSWGSHHSNFTNWFLKYL